MAVDARSGRDGVRASWRRTGPGLRSADWEQLTGSLLGSVYLWEQARALMCAACSTPVCLPLLPLEHQPFFSPPPSHPPPSVPFPLCDADFPSVVLSVVVKCVQRGSPGLEHGGDRILDFRSPFTSVHDKPQTLWLKESTVTS